MRAFWVGLAVMLLTGAASAEGVSDNGQPFPSQVGGWRFGMTRPQAEEVCKKAGGTIAEATTTQNESAFFCTPVPDPPSVFAKAPNDLRADICGTKVCELKMFWGRMTSTEVGDIARVLSTKYGTQAANEGSPGLAMLDFECRRDPAYSRNQVVVWLFSVKGKGGALEIGGTMSFVVGCEKGGGLTAMLSYQDREASYRRLRRNSANY